MKQPLVSIILSSYNGEKYIKESIDSVLQQSYSNFEFIIVNDASTDTTHDIIQKYRHKDQRIVYLQNDINLKLTRSLNKGLAHAQGEYIARIDDDDMRTQDKLEKQVQYMHAHPSCVLCGSSASIIDAHENHIRDINMRTDNHNIRKYLLQSNQFIHSSVLIRKKSLDAVDFYNPKWNGVEDYDLWLRLGNQGNMHNIKEYLIHYRRLDTSISRKNHFTQQRHSLLLCTQYRRSYPRFFQSLGGRILFMLVTAIIGEHKAKVFLQRLHILLSGKKLS